MMMTMKKIVCYHSSSKKSKMRATLKFPKKKIQVMAWVLAIDILNRAIKKRRGYYAWISLGFFILLLFSGVIFVWKDTQAIGTTPIDHSKLCHKPSVRKEWRSLNSSSQHAYISAVICLMHHPSIFQEDTSYYDDFIYAHSQTGRYSHYAAAFLPWHRMYVRTFERALQEKCEYRGAQP